VEKNKRRSGRICVKMRIKITERVAHLRSSTSNQEPAVLGETWISPARLDKVIKPPTR